MDRMLRQTAIVSAFIILGLAVFVATEHATSPVFQQCIDKHEHENVTESSDYSLASLGSIIGANVRCSGDFVDSHASGITALATLMIAAFTLTLWIATSQQARLTQEALIADKRAFVFADGLVPLWMQPDTAHPVGFRWRLRPKWRNTGATPTKNLQLHVECEVRNSILPAGYIFAPQNGIIGNGIIPPNAELYGGEAPAGGITPQDILDAQRFEKFIYLWGWVKYFDVFPNTPEHITHFCWLVTVSGDPFAFTPNALGQPLSPLIFNYLQHTEGNYAEDK
jgi:hypothetical protein